MVRGFNSLSKSRADLNCLDAGLFIVIGVMADAQATMCDFPCPLGRFFGRNRFFLMEIANVHNRQQDGKLSNCVRCQILISKRSEVSG